MGRPVIENLRPPKTPKEAQERGRKGGIASGKSRKMRRNLKEIANMLLDMKAPDEIQEKIKAILPDIDEEEMTNRLAIVQRLIINALAGDNKAFELLRDQIGEKPREIIEQTNTNIDITDKKIIDKVINDLKEL